MFAYFYVAQTWFVYTVVHTDVSDSDFLPPLLLLLCGFHTNFYPNEYLVVCAAKYQMCCNARDVNDEPSHIGIRSLYSIFTFCARLRCPQIAFDVSVFSLCLLLVSSFLFLLLSVFFFLLSIYLAFRLYRSRGRRHARLCSSTYSSPNIKKSLKLATPTWNTTKNYPCEMCAFFFLPLSLSRSRIYNGKNEFTPPPFRVSTTFFFHFNSLLLVSLLRARTRLPLRMA